MNSRNPPVPAAPPPCRCCGRPYDADSVRPIGMFAEVHGQPPLIIYPCVCGTTRAVSWDQASAVVKERARMAQEALANRRAPEDR